MLLSLAGGCQMRYRVSMTNTAPQSARRVSRPERFQREWQDFCLDEVLPEGDIARIVWAYATSLDLSALYEDITVSEHDAGRPAIAPELLVALWLQATLDSVGSARELDRRCTRDSRYRWLCGGVSVNYHTLSDFRSNQADFLQTVLVDSVAALIDQGLVPLETIAQDGMRTKASAGSSSFRRKPTLEELQRQAAEHLEQLQLEAKDESARQQADARTKAARERAARERKKRIDEALRQRDELAQQREQRKKGDGTTTRCSTTDPEARRMKMANGGFDPGFNVQFATDAHARIIVGVDVTNEGTDGSQLPPMLDQLESDYGKRPQQALVDSAFATKESVTQAESSGTQVFGGIPRASQLEKNGKDPCSPQKGDTAEYKAFRARMALAESQTLFKTRPSVAEFPNAVCRNHGLRQFLVRGLAKAKAVALWHALAFNFRRMVTLGVLK